MKDKKSILGINKRTKYMHKFIGKASLILDNIRLNKVKRKQDFYACQKIKNDDIKLEAIPFLNDYDVLEIVQTIKDDDKKIYAIKNFLKNNYAKSKAICTLNNDNHKIELMKTLNFDNKEKCEIVCSLQEDEKKENLLNTMEFDIISKCEIVCSLQEDERKEKLLNKLELDNNLKARIIGSFDSVDKILQLLDEGSFDKKMKSEVLEGLSDNKKVEIIKDSKIDLINKVELIESLENQKVKKQIYKELEISEEDLAEKYFSQREDNAVKQKYNAFGLPKEMTIGIEIEAEGMYKNIFIKNFNQKGWEKEKDGSLGIKGVEIISPIMSDEAKYIEEIYQVTSSLQNYGFLATEKCGGHVHIGADYLKSGEAFMELLEIFGNSEEILYLISNKPGELPRKNINTYAPPISKKIEQSYLGKEQTDEFIKDAQEVQEDRNTSINLMNVNNGKNTIEFRLSNGTIDPNIWIENIRLYGRTMQMAQEISNINMKLQQGEKVTQEEIKKLQMKSILKKDVSREEKIDALMNLLFDEEEQKIYKERYERNKQLYDKEETQEKMEFGIVDFKKVYDEVEIPKDIISQLRENRNVEKTEKENMVDIDGKDR